MEENTNATLDDKVKEEDKENSNKEKLQEEKSYSASDITKAVEDAKKQWQSEQDQAARLAKLSKDDREKEQLRIEKENFDKEKAEFQKKLLIVETENQLIEKGLSRVFAKNICGETAEETKANIEMLEKEWKAAIEEGVNEKLKGKAPKGGAASQGQPTGSFFDIIKENQRI